MKEPESLGGPPRERSSGCSKGNRVRVIVAIPCVNRCGPLEEEPRLHYYDTLTQARLKAAAGTAVQILEITEAWLATGGERAMEAVDLDRPKIPRVMKVSKL